MWPTEQMEVRSKSCFGFTSASRTPAIGANSKRVTGGTPNLNKRTCTITTDKIQERHPKGAALLHLCYSWFLEVFYREECGMQKIRSLLTHIAHKNWGSRSLMQEARLSGEAYTYLPVALPYPWAKALSFTCNGTIYTLKIARKKQVHECWVPICIASLEPKPKAEDVDSVFCVLQKILYNPQALP